MPCYLQPQKGDNFTMIGAISTKSNKAYVEIAERTSKDEVVRFFHNYLPNHKGAVLVMDNHKSH